MAKKVSLFYRDKDNSTLMYDMYHYLRDEERHVNITLIDKGNRIELTTYTTSMDGICFSVERNGRLVTCNKYLCRCFDEVTPSDIERAYEYMFR